MTCSPKLPIADWVVLNEREEKSMRSWSTFAPRANPMKHLVTGFVVLVGTVLATPSLAQMKDKSDKSGTNPVNFTNDVRLYHEYQDLEGGGTGNITTFEGRTPVFDGKMQLRTRIPYKWVDNNATIDESDLGDINVRALIVPFIDLKKTGTALALGLEVFLPTAGKDALGEGKISLGPQIFGVKFAPFGIKGSLIAPAIQEVFSVAGEGSRASVHRTQLDVFFLKQSADKKLYALVDPQYIIDHNNDKQFGLLESDFGYVFDAGFTGYVRPGIGFGPDKPFDWNFEFGIKFIF